LAKFGLNHLAFEISYDRFTIAADSFLQRSL